MATRRKSTVLATQRPKKNRLRFLGSPAVKKVLWYLFNLFFLAALVTMIACAVYGYSITDDLVERFEGKRWKIPSRVFSDALTLVPGGVG
ncbi:MAG: hypothetical protein M5R36_20870 [Deltaproteobacteria bacterium]|nr:hypothetical protein [Deltaproteobacteria bacterium]